MDFSQFVASGIPAIAEGAVVERIRRDPNIALDPHILNGGLIYDPAGRARLAEIHSDYMRSAREAGLTILMFTDTWRCSQNLVQASCFRDCAVNEDNARFLIELRDAAPTGPPAFIGGWSVHRGTHTSPPTVWRGPMVAWATAALAAHSATWAASKAARVALRRVTRV
jgi:homocysteine S-methyltransferase